MLVTLFDGFLDDPFGSEGASLEHFLKADDVVVVDDLEYLLEAFFLVVVLVGFDGRGAQEDVEG